MVYNADKYENREILFLDSAVPISCFFQLIVLVSGPQTLVPILTC